MEVRKLIGVGSIVWISGVILSDKDRKGKLFNANTMKVFKLLVFNFTFRTSYKAIPQD